ncbi:MAG: OstA-like protein [bacterium]|nr:OstA-like protein [bacterium]
MRVSALLFVVVVIFCSGVSAQDDMGPQQPVILENADSVVGAGPLETGIRKFFGRIRFRQGNVLVTCDRAVQYILENRADLFGHVVITQGSMTLRAPTVQYDGNRLVADAHGGVTVNDQNRTIRARSGTYSTFTHIATFLDSVRIEDDSVLVWSDTVHYNRDTKLSTAFGRVLIASRDSLSWMQGDSATHDPAAKFMKVWGNAASWSIDKEDTTFLAADTLESFREGAAPRYRARGRGQLVRGGVAALADTLIYDEASGRIYLRSKPILWSDSLQLTADTIDVFAPNKHLSSVVGTNTAFLISRSDSVRADRFDQIAGRQITLNVENDTVRNLIAVDNAKNITWYVEDDKPKGLARFTADTIKAYFEQGQITDVFWRIGVEGEHHPENIVAGRELDYRLPGFLWRTDRPRRRPLPAPFRKSDAGM